jgi:hypothetical protein
MRISLARWCRMRCLLAAAIVSTLILPAVGRAQESQPSIRGDRLFLSAGLGWGACHCRLQGGQLRAEYSVTPPEYVVGLRVQLGAFWAPTQRYSFPSALYPNGSFVEGVGRSTTLDFGVTGSITPWPRGGVSPYFVAGLAALHTWTHGSGYYPSADGTAAWFMAPGFGGHNLRAIVGAGLRVRVSNRLLQLEARELRGSLSAVSLGTALHF